MGITASIMNLNFNLLILYILDTFVDIQYSRLVFIRETIIEVVANQAGFTYRCITNKNDFDLFLLAIFYVRLPSSYGRIRYGLLRYSWI